MDYYCKTTTSWDSNETFWSTIRDLRRLHYCAASFRLENQQCCIIALHSFYWESAMLHHCAASFRLRISNAASLRCILSTGNQQCCIIALHPFDWESAMLHHCAAFFLLGISNAALLRCILSTENQQCNSSCDEPNWSTIRWIDTHSPGKG